MSVNSKPREFTLIYSEAEVLERLKSVLQISQASDLAELIVHKSTVEDLKLIWKCLSGVSLATKYKIGQEFYVKFTDLPTWRYTTGQLDLFQNSVKVVITAVNKYSQTPYEVAYKVTKDGIEEVDTYNVFEKSLLKMEELPDEEDLLEFFIKVPVNVNK